MRVIAGALGGRSFGGPAGDRTHPMSDKVRGALFNALGELDDLTVLDAFAGSGAISYEAVSRGARSVTAIESDRRAQRAINDNLLSLALADRISLIAARAQSWLATAESRFDIVICDPPYHDPQLPLLMKLAARVKPGGIVVLSLPPGSQLSLPANFSCLSHKDYGDAQLYFYQRAR